MLIKNKQGLFIATPILAISLLSGCGGGGSGSDEVTYNQLWNDEFQSCGTNCHNPSAPDGTENGPDLSTIDGFYANLLNKTVNTDYPLWNKGSDCDDTPFINPNNAAKSLIVTGLIQSDADNIVASGDCTTSSYNEHVAKNVSYNNPTAVVEWINSGASKTSSVNAN